MKPTPQAIENAARAMSSSKAWPVVFEAGSALILAKASLSCDLGDMVLVPKEPTNAMLHELFVLPDFGPDGRIIRHSVDKLPAAYRAMIAAAEGEPCK